MHFLRCGGIVIHYRAKGSDNGKPVIALINSLGTDFHIWDAVCEDRRKRAMIPSLTTDVRVRNGNSPQSVGQ